MPDKTFVLVTGATGLQGGTVARKLLAHGHRVRALTRKPESPAVKELVNLGAEISIGNFDDRSSLERAATGLDAIFAMGTSFEAGTEAETRQAISIAETAKKLNIDHLVYSSVGGADQNTGIPHFESKYKVEQKIISLDIPYTIFGPVFFCENHIAPWSLPGLQQGQLVLAFPKDRKFQQIALQDIGGFATLVIEQRDKFLGKRMDIAGAEPTGLEMAEVLTKVTGRHIEYIEIPLDHITSFMGEEGYLMYKWFHQVGYNANIDALRKDYPEVGWHNFEDWAKTVDWRILDQPAPQWGQQ